MTLHVECGYAGGGAFDGMHMPVERSGLQWSETLSSDGTTTNSATQYTVLTLTADVDGWFAIGAAPDASADPRRRILAGQQRSFAAQPGDKVDWVAA